MAFQIQKIHDLKTEIRTYNNHPFVFYSQRNMETNQTKEFDNAHYCIIDMNSKAYRKAVDHAGGFLANMTRRKTPELEKEYGKTPCYLMLACLPQDSLMFQFAFAYLDTDKQLITQYPDTDHEDYLYFHHKLKDAVCETGIVFDILDKPAYHDIFYTKDNTPIIKAPRPYFAQADGQPVLYDSVLETDDITVYKKQFQENLEKAGAVKIILQLDASAIDGICIRMSALDKYGNPVSTLGLRYGCTSAERLENWGKMDDEEKEHYLDMAADPFISTNSGRILQDLIDKHQFKIQPPQEED